MMKEKVKAFLKDLFEEIKRRFQNKKFWKSVSVILGEVSELTGFSEKIRVKIIVKFGEKIAPTVIDVVTNKAITGNALKIIAQAIIDAVDRMSESGREVGCAN